jgi:hypothetical protein
MVLLGSKRNIPSILRSKMKTKYVVSRKKLLSNLETKVQDLIHLVEDGDISSNKIQDNLVWIMDRLAEGYEIKCQHTEPFIRYDPFIRDIEARLACRR